MAPPVTATATAAQTRPARPARSRLARDLATVPNLLSVSRLLAVIAGFVLYLVGWRLAALGLGLWAGISDYLDGIVARRTGQVTELGAVLDRQGDLLGESFAFILVVDLDVVSPVFFMLYLLRELVVVSARQYVSEHKDRGVQIRSSLLGKLKSNFLLYSLLLLLLVHSGAIDSARLVDGGHDLATFGLCAGLVFSYLSAALYLRAFARSYNAG